MITARHAAPAAVTSLLLGHSRVMVALREQLDRIARSSATVLITGDTGTGKEMVARYLHAKSPRHAMPLIALNCAALPEALIESELFGHARSAFTGAHAAYPGKIRLAAGGKLFLDEIGDMAPQAQARLLRFLETGEVFSVGGLRTDTVDVRVVGRQRRKRASDPGPRAAGGRRHTHPRRAALDAGGRLGAARVAATGAGRHRH